MFECVQKDENDNCILGNEPKLINSRVKFKGKNNILVCDGRVTLRDSNIFFEADNSIIYLSHNIHDYYLHISIFNNSVLFMEEQTYLAGSLTLILSESKNIFIGRNCMFAKDVYVRLADPHLIYDVETMGRINLSKSIYIGDHVWFGQEVLLLKGCKIGSGSIIGARAVLSNKIIPSNSLWGGIPARELRKNIFYDSSSVHFYTDEETSKSMVYEDDCWIYKNEGEIISFDEIENNLNTLDVYDKIDYLIKIKNNGSHNRFYISDE